MVGVKSLVTGLKRVSVVAALCGLGAACGGNDGLRINKETSPGTNEQRPNVISETGLALHMPSNLPLWVDTAQIVLEKAESGSSAGCSRDSKNGKLLGLPCAVEISKHKGEISFDFPLTGKPIQINSLAQGEYWIRVSILNTKTGRLHSEGEGNVTVKAGQLATAHITMTQVGDENGSLVIVLDDGQSIKPLPPIAPAGCATDEMYRAPVCVSVGKALVYRFQDLTVDPKTCKWGLPVGVQRVDSKFCEGLSVGAAAIGGK